AATNSCMGSNMDAYLTTKEVAALLRVKERKVYDLAATGALPCTKAMGKLLFPRGEIEAWLASGAQPPLRSAKSSERRTDEPPSVFLGSHDPLLEWALRESRAGIATYFDGSGDGVRRLAEGEGIAAGLHLFDAETGGWNSEGLLGTAATRPVVLIEWARRQRGLIVAESVAERVRGLTDLPGVSIAARQPGAGAEHLFHHLLSEAGIDRTALHIALHARSETDAAQAVAEGRADLCFGLAAVARLYRLDFVPVIEERYDLLVDRRAWFEPPLQALLAFCRSEAMQARAAAQDGYDMAGFGTVHFNGP
ncbi:MAG: helix-turn-helix transcriptional regulator, partial [Pseudomonadota bacterium]